MGLFDIFRINEFKRRIEELENNLRKLGFTEYEQTKDAIKRMNDEADARLASINRQVYATRNALSELEVKKAALQAEADKLEKQCGTAQRKLNRCKELYRAVDYALQTSLYDSVAPTLLSASDKNDFDELAPTVTLKLHCMDVKDLRKAYRENEKQIEAVVDRYKERYTTKSNKTIYDLMVIALRAEIQNILYTLKYEKLDVAVESVKAVTAKYFTIATNGNQNIASTIKKFIGEIEYLFINAVKIEYNYYVKKEQARQEQIAIREKMRQEAEERKALELERKRIEAEEQKYIQEMQRIREQISAADEETAKKLEAELASVESSLSDVVVKKEEIVNLQNGKAGNIYIISNLGSFGENIFKIGMTRRLNPQERVDELGSASVPFKFDVHSFIFSEDAVALETALHHRLNNQRVNKVNMRKEFFYSTIDELEALTMELSPSAEFTRTMVAEEYRQSLSSEENYSSDYSPYEEDEE